MTPTPPEGELKPCPFCGSADIDPRYALAEEHGVQHASPGCINCGGMADTVEKWNTRTAPEQLDSAPVAGWQDIDDEARFGGRILGYHDDWQEWFTAERAAREQAERERDALLHRVHEALHTCPRGHGLQTECYGCQRDTALARIAELESDLAHERRLALQAAKDK